MKTTSSLLFTLIVLSLFFTSCQPEDVQVSQTKTFYSEGANDGIIVNSSPLVVKDYYVGGQGKEITIGWDASGYSMRGYISFNTAELFPKDGSKLVIDNAVVSVYEANTNLLPFTAEGVNRVVECYLVNYGTLDPSDYSDSSISNCGVIATTGYSVLTEHPLNVTAYLNSDIKANTLVDKTQFRLQFTSNANVKSTSLLAQAMWNIFSGEHTNKDYLPKLVIKYHYEK